MNIANPAVRWGFGLWGGAVIAAVALLFFEGTMQLLLLSFAVFDAAFTPLFLKYVAENPG